MERYTSAYYADYPVPALTPLSRASALIVIDLQRCYFRLGTPEADAPFKGGVWPAFHRVLAERTVPAARALISGFRRRALPVMFARIATVTASGGERSLSQKLPGFNNILMHRDSPEAQFIEGLEPLPGEIEVIKSTDSALTGTNLRLLLRNLGIENTVLCGIFTDQCVSSTARSLSDESFRVYICDDACAAATEELHAAELTILNRIYASVVSSRECLDLLPG